MDVQHVFGACATQQMTQVTVPSYSFNYNKTSRCCFVYVINCFIFSNPNCKKQWKFKFKQLGIQMPGMKHKLKVGGGGRLYNSTINNSCTVELRLNLHIRVSERKAEDEGLCYGRCMNTVGSMYTVRQFCFHLADQCYCLVSVEQLVSGVVCDA